MNSPYVIKPFKYHAKWVNAKASQHNISIYTHHQPKLAFFIHSQLQFIPHSYLYHSYNSILLSFTHIIIIVHDHFIDSISVHGWELEKWQILSYIVSADLNIFGHLQSILFWNTFSQKRFNISTKHCHPCSEATHITFILYLCYVFQNNLAC